VVVQVATETDGGGGEGIRIGDGLAEGLGEGEGLVEGLSVELAAGLAP
jgi:hypothetical protein